MKDYHLLNGSNLAYIGDAYYELKIRTYLLSTGLTKTKDLQKASLALVSAKAHHQIYYKIHTLLNDEEKQIFKRGRNAQHSPRKNINLVEHAISSGFEAVIGYLYLKKDWPRLDFLITAAINASKDVNTDEK